MDNHVIKERKGNKVTIIGFIILVLVIGGIIGGYFLMNKAKETPEFVPQETVAKVDGHDIGSALYTYLYFNAKMGYEQQKQVSGAAARTFWTTDNIEGKRASEWLEDYAMESAKQIALEMADAAKKGITLTDDEKNKGIQSAKDSLKQQFTEVTNGDYNKVVGQTYHITQDEYINLMSETGQIISKYNQALQDDFKKQVPDKDALKTYNKNKDDYKTAKVRHILFMTVGADGKTPLSKAEQAKAKKDADKTLEKIKHGQDMIKLVAQYSQDTGKNQKKGQDGYQGLYTVNKDSSLVTEFKNFALKNKVGTLKVVKTDYGYHVMRVESAEIQPFNKVKDKINSDEIQKLATAYLDKLSKDKKVTDKNEGFFVKIRNILITQVDATANPT